MIKLSKRDNRKLQEKAKNDLKNIRKALKKEPVVIDMFKKSKRDINEIDDVKITFDNNLDVSAKTVNGDIFLNAEMLKDDWKDYFHYAIHELSHFIDHTSGKCAPKNKDEDYLDNPSEISAFKNQLKYRKKTEPKDDVNEYVEELFDKHDLPEKERSKKKKQLLGN